MQENKPVLIVGLGNPGKEYELTRHNVGFMAIDNFASDGVWKKEKNALTLHDEQNGQKIIYVKPQTFMNNSGDAVAQLMAFYKIPLENLIVIHDDMDLKIGDVRQKIGGSSAGHNGIKSIDKMVGPDYKRIRIGIGHPRDFDLPINPADWVLGKFTTEQLHKIKEVIKDLIILS
ncbi:MAG: aminoacyl-tRNA hydrolase [Alphaproteobacteria bacterium]|nr:aminoacyl-tRNA hydrolase [Alphaproteobacteria bacterium]